jgi:hypothetical protein
MYLTETEGEGVDWVKLAKDRVKLQVLENVE